ncbi:MAG TPA: hypothetical protein VHZ77_08950 [Gaiellaceae bacterium]|jgi:hypothetical protein|nr:hypothetical protein [Gaiellaceae bacterium]
MIPDYRHVLALRNSTLRPDRRPAPSDSEIRLRVKRLNTRIGA